MENANSDSTLRRMFAGLSEYVFHSKLGVVDTELVDYVSTLLTRFIRLEGLQRIRRVDGSLATEVFSMVEEAEKRVGEAKREVHRHIGDFTLFWSGVYPEALREMRGDGTKDYFVNYCAQGKRAYRIASSLDVNDKSTKGQLLHRLSDQFEMCAYGLREIRREWESKDESGDGPLLI